MRFGARDYQASTGRWLSKEPLRFGGSRNFYEFAFADPVDALDVDGAEVVWPDDNPILSATLATMLGEDPFFRADFDALNADPTVQVLFGGAPPGGGSGLTLPLGDFTRRMSGKGCHAGYDITAERYEVFVDMFTPDADNTIAHEFGHLLQLTGRMDPPTAGPYPVIWTPVGEENLPAEWDAPLRDQRREGSR